MPVLRGKKANVVKLTGKPIRSPSKGRVMVEDAVSSALVEFPGTMELLSEFFNAVSTGVKGAVAYPHGGFGIMLHAERAGVLDFVKDGANRDHALTRLYEKAVGDLRDVDMVVVVEGGLKGCTTLNKCIKQNAVMDAVARELRTLRVEMHNLLRDNYDAILGAIRDKLGNDDVEIVYMPHITIAKDGKDTVLHNRGEAGKRNLACTPDNMFKLDAASKQDRDEQKRSCTPFADRYNLTPNFSSKYKGDGDGDDAANLTHAFTLVRLAMGVKVGGRVVPVNFFDVSVPMADDYIYQDGYNWSMQLVDVDYSNGHWKAASLAYMMDAAQIQLSNLITANDGGKFDAKIEKLQHRLELILLLQRLGEKRSQTSSMRSSSTKSRIQKAYAHVLDNKYNQKDASNKRDIIESLVHEAFGDAFPRALYENVIAFVDANTPYQGVKVDRFSEFSLSVRSTNSRSRSRTGTGSTRTRSRSSDSVDGSFSRRSPKK